MGTPRRRRGRVLIYIFFISNFQMTHNSQHIFFFPSNPNSLDFFFVQIPFFWSKSILSCFFFSSSLCGIGGVQGEKKKKDFEDQLSIRNYHPLSLYNGGQKKKEKRKRKQGFRKSSKKGSFQV